MVFLVFQSTGARADPPGVPGSEYNYALASNGGTASASGYYQNNVPARAIDGNPSNYWQSSTTTGWLAVNFSRVVTINQVHAHFLAKAYASLSLYYDRNGDGDFADAEERVWTTTANAGLDVRISTPAFSALGVQITIDARSGTSKPQIAELEAYRLPDDSDGDGLYDPQEASTVYYQDMGADGLPDAIPDDDANTAGDSVNLAPFYGVPERAMANFTVDHTAKSELTASIGYWNGSAWVDHYVWDPGNHLAGIPITQPDGTRAWRGTIPVVAAVAYPDTTQKVEFRVGGVLRGTVTTPSGSQYLWDWDAGALGDADVVLNATQIGVNGPQAWDQVTVHVDNLPPAATWVAPTEGETVGSTYAVTVDASDAYGIGKVDLYVDGTTLIGTDPLPDSGTSRYVIIWDPSAMPRGTHALKAVATEALDPGRSTTIFRNVTVRTGLGLRITQPSTVGYYDGNVAVTAYVDHPEYTTRVEFRAGGSLFSTITTPVGNEYRTTWATSGDATILLNVTQYDSFGAGAWYEVPVKVNNLPPSETWRNPMAGQAVSGYVTLQLSASDVHGVSGVAFYVDGVWKTTVPDPYPVNSDTYSWLWNTAGLVAGL